MLNPYTRLVTYYVGLSDEMFQLKNQFNGDLNRARACNDTKSINAIGRIVKELNSIESVHKEAIHYWRKREEEFKNGI